MPLASQVVNLQYNGAYPEVLEELINLKLLDYIAMDVKAPLDRYHKITRSNVSPDKIKQSIGMIMDSGVAYEFRTTVVKSLLKKRDLQEIAISIRDARLYVLQKFVPSKCLEKRFLSQTTYSDKEFEALKGEVKDLVRCIVVR